MLRSLFWTAGSFLVIIIAMHIKNKGTFIIAQTGDQLALSRTLSGVTLRCYHSSSTARFELWFNSEPVVHLFLSLPSWQFSCLHANVPPLLFKQSIKFKVTVTYETTNNKKHDRQVRSVPCLYATLLKHCFQHSLVQSSRHTYTKKMIKSMTEMV